jgi:hypothetical protein
VTFLQTDANGEAKKNFFDSHCQTILDAHEYFNKSTITVEHALFIEASYLSDCNIDQVPVPVWTNLNRSTLIPKPKSKEFRAKLYVVLKVVFRIPYAQAKRFPVSLLSNIPVQKLSYSVVSVTDGNAGESFFCFPAWIMYLFRIYAASKKVEGQSSFFGKGNVSDIISDIKKQLDPKWDNPNTKSVISPSVRDAMIFLKDTLTFYDNCYKKEGHYHVWYCFLCEPALMAINADLARMIDRES